MILTGTIVNSAAIVAGSIAGLLLGKFIPERFSDAMEKGAALCVLYIGVDGMLAGENTLVAILSIAIGAILGELLQLDEHMHQLGGVDHAQVLDAAVAQFLAHHARKRAVARFGDVRDA